MIKLIRELGRNSAGLLRKNLRIIILFSLFVFVRLIWVLIAPSYPIDDHMMYHQLARKIIEGQQIWLPTAARPLGYPFFISLLYKIFGEKFAVVRFFNIILSTVTAILFFKYVKKIYSKRVAEICLLLLAFFPSLIFVNSLLSSEVLYLFLISLIFLPLLAKRSFLMIALMGFIIGLSSNVKPISLLLPLVFFVYFLITEFNLRKSFWLTLVFSLFLIIAVLPALYRNYRVLGTLVPISTNSGFNLYATNNLHGFGDASYYTKLDMEKENYSEIEADELYKKNALYYIVKNKGDFLLTFFYKFYRTFLDSDDNIAFWSLLELERPADVKKMGVIRESFQELSNRYYKAVLFLALFYLIFSLLGFLRVKKNKKEYFGLLFILYLTFFSSIFSGSSRYHFPGLIFLAMYAARMINIILVTINNEKNKKN